MRICSCHQFKQNRREQSWNVPFLFKQGSKCDNIRLVTYYVTSLATVDGGGKGANYTG